MKISRPCIFIAIFLMLLSHSFAQIFNDIEWYDVDSLHEILPLQSGTEKINTINRLSASLSFEDATQSNAYAQQALQMSEAVNYQEGIAAANRNFGRIAFYNGNYPRALAFYQMVFDQYQKMNNQNLSAKVLVDILVTHFYARNFEKAMEIIDSVQAFYRKRKADGTTVGNVRDTLTLSSRLGLAYRTLGRSDRALSIYLDYLKIGAEHHFEITDMLVHHGLVAQCYQELGKLDSALVYYRKALAFPNVNLGIQSMNHEHMRRMAGIYLARGQTDSAVIYLDRAFEWLSEKGFLMQSQMAARQLGEIYEETGPAEKAIHFFETSEKLTREMMLKNSFYRYDSLKYNVSWGRELYLPFTTKIMKEFIYNLAVPLYLDMHRYYLNKGQPEKAINYILEYTAAKDTLRELSRNREIIEIQTKYETEKKEEQIGFLSHENELKEYKLRQSKILLFGVIGVMALVTFIALILIRQKQLKSRQKGLVIQQKLLRSQMNPHFIFNSLSSIQHLIVEEDAEKASIYLAKFSTLVRNILSGSAQEYITIENEIKTIGSYLALQKIRYPKKFDYTVSVDPKIETESLTIPPMLAQPFIENAIEHGMKHKKDMGHIDIRFQLSGDLIIFEVEDDGIGREEAGRIKSKQSLNHQSMATAITIDRLKVLNKKLKKKIELRIMDLKNESGEATGTKVVMEIPFDVV
jgi:tetratricopeptide (TPR) repeat protein